jgi:hypothetical protein
MFQVSVGELHAMDLGAHIHIMDEWNEENSFKWGPATISLMGFTTLVVQEDGTGCTHVCTYLTNGEGDLLSLRVYGGPHHGIEGVEYWHWDGKKLSMDEMMAAWDEAHAKGKRLWDENGVS